MKTVKITLLQVDGSTFEVKSFSNTPNLHIGQKVPRSKVIKWMDMSRVYVSVAGMAKPQEPEIGIDSNASADMLPMPEVSQRHLDKSDC